MQRYDDLERNLGSNIKRFRCEQRISQEKLGVMIGGRSRQFIASIEKGRSSMQVRILRDIANALDVHPMILMFGIFPDDHPGNPPDLPAKRPEDL